MTGAAPVGRSRGEWTVALPAQQPSVPGVRLVGFLERTGLPFSELLLPSPTVSIVIDCAGGSLSATSVGSAALVSGVAPANERVHGSYIDCLEVELSPLLVPALFDVDPRDLGHAVVALDELWGRDAERLTNQLHQVQSWERRFAELDNVLVRRYNARARPDGEIVDAWRRIIRSGGQVSITALTERYGWSRTRLWRRFTSQLGISPKHAARIARFHGALRRISRGEELAAVAAASGYTDQSHMHREFREFTLTTPKSFQGDPLWSELT
ncbi:helix-turn-helix domain-containing protein [Micromonospora endolithica]|nr:AraC family transcriptional regulator [Micromonospora endolithica]TWJ20129.1 AraC-like DNA-binding protein [Micromonospora endolithica]